MPKNTLERINERKAQREVKLAGKDPRTAKNRETQYGTISAALEGLPLLFTSLTAPVDTFSSASGFVTSASKIGLAVKTGKTIKRKLEYVNTLHPDYLAWKEAQESTRPKVKQMGCRP